MRDTLGKYQLLTPLSVGGMAELHLACMPGPGGFKKFVALKQILPDVRQDEQFVQMFLDEARLTAALSHPNIGQVFDLGQEDGELYLAMEFISGVNLSQVLRRVAKLGTPPPPGFACRVVRDACLALHQAHTFRDPATDQPQPIVHRDISPKNIMVTFDGVVKVIDFGIAKSRGRLIRTQVGQVKGTIPYMSPEQLVDEPLDGRSDLFSLGIVLWELLTGSRLHAGRSEADTVMRIVEKDAPKPSTAAKVTPELDAVVLKALARDRDRRFATGRELAKALEQACPGLFDEEQLSAWVAELFPETKSTLRSLLSAAQSDTVDPRELTTQARKLRKADASAAEDRATPGPAPTRPSRPSSASPPAAVATRTQATPGLSRKLLFFGLGAAGVAVLGLTSWVLLLGYGAKKVLDEAPPPGLELEKGTLKPGDADLDDGDRAREAEVALRNGDFDRLRGLLSLCLESAPSCTQTRAVLREVQTLQQTRCEGGVAAFDVLQATWTQLRQHEWSTARASIDACRHERGIAFRVQALQERVNTETQADAYLDRAEKLMQAKPLFRDDLDEARSLVERSRSTVIAVDRLRPLDDAIAAATRELLDRPRTPPPVVEPPPAPPVDDGLTEAEKLRLLAQTQESRKRATAAELEALMDEARREAGAKHYKAAIDKLESCVKRDPGAYACHMLLGSTYARMGSAEGDVTAVQKALASYERFLELAPPDHPRRSAVLNIVANYGEQKKTKRRR